ncbi:MAG: RHS repeat-associated core domain-containing protein [Archangium sp.]|nr:RHS repeat-associated core domain-containing protein [Archangium sp.]
MAKATTANGSSWSERLVLDFWPDETLKQVDAVDYAGGSNEVRRIQKFAADSHLRPTWSQVGEGSGSFKLTRGFDGADNPTARSVAYNLTAPTFCRNAPDGSKSPLCTWLEFDRADRPAVFDVYPDGGTTGERSCFDYDASGNVSRVSRGCAASLTSFSSCALNTGGLSTCDSSASDFKFDDFGNLVQAELPNTGDAGSGRGVVRFEHDALGNVTRKQTSEMAAAAKHILYVYDGLGRLSSVNEATSSSQVQVYGLTYDTATPPCGTVANQGGRLAKVTDPLFETWYSYTPEGYLAKELRKRAGQSCTGVDPTASGGSDTTTHTLYGYTAAGDLETVTYPHGRKVTYSYGSSSRRISGVSVDEWSGSAWSSQTLLSNVVWEPFGGLRGYVMNFVTSATTGTVEYMLGDNSQAAPSSDCPSSFSGSSDKTGRLRALRVQSGTVGYGTSGYQGDIYRRTYVWRADQVAETRTCLKGSSSAQTEVFEYDSATRLRSASVPNFSTTGGYQAGHQYSYDARGNRTQWIVDACCGSAVTSSYYAAPRPDQLEMDGPWGDTAAAHHYAYDRDGRTTFKRWPTTTGNGTYGDYLHFEYDAPGADTAVSSISRRAWPTAGSSWTTPIDATWTYVHDAWSRRVAKVYPVNDVRDEFFYDTQRQMLEDRGLKDLSATEHPIDEYVWLDGRPVAQLRAKFSSSFARAADRTGRCPRVTDGSLPACDFYFLVTDHIGKPVLMLNSRGKVAGVGEYDPFGRVNAVEWWNASSSPYTTAQWFGQFSQPTYAAQGMTTQLRGYYSLLDLERNCSFDVSRDFVYFVDAATSQTKSSFVAPFTHWMRGNQYSDWMTESSSSGLSQYVYDWSGTGTHYAQGNCSTTQSYRGVQMRRYEYRRFENAAHWGTDMSWKQSTTVSPDAGWQNPGFDDSSWSGPFDEGAHGATPWTPAPSFPSGTPARWIWYRDSRTNGDTGTAYFRKTFSAAGGRAALTLTADDAFTAYVNGTLVASSTAYWWQPVTVEVDLIPGASNVLAVVAVNNGGPGGLLVDVTEQVAPLWTAHRFPGQYFDAETDLYENGHRFYDPELGRYTAPEPIQRDPYSHVLYAYAGHSLPAYSYALNNPVHFVDFNGRDPAAYGDAIVEGQLMFEGKMTMQDQANRSLGVGAGAALGLATLASISAFASLLPAAPALSMCGGDAAKRLAESAARRGVPWPGFEAWGRALWGQRAEGAREAIRNMTSDKARSLDPAKVQKALDFYQKLASEGVKGTDTAQARADLMQHILNLQSRP